MKRRRCIHILNALIRVNNNRIICYKSSLQQLIRKRDRDLQSLFRRMIRNGLENKEALSSQIALLGGSITDRPTPLFGLHHAWLRFKAWITGYDLKAILNNCERVEASIQRTYKAALRKNIATG